MHTLAALLTYAAAVFLGGALIAPWLYEVTQSAAGIVPVLRSLAENPFHRFVHRSILVLALIGLWPLLRSLGVRSWLDVGLKSPRGEVVRTAAGFAVGFVSLAVVALLTLLTGARELDLKRSIGDFVGQLAKAGTVALGVSVLEELLFRGVLFGALRKACRWQVAVVVSSAIYAVVHFFSRPASPAEVNWLSGIVVLFRMLQGFVEIQELVPGFFNLTLAGAMLALVYQRTGNLYFSIGLHAGWIFWLKSYGFLTQDVSDAVPWIWGSSKMIDGWLALAVLGVTALVVIRIPLPGDRPEPGYAKTPEKRPENLA